RHTRSKRDWSSDVCSSDLYNLTLASMVLAVLNANHHWPIGWAILAALGSSVAVGVVNGAFVIIFGIDPFIVTLGTGTFVYGVVQIGRASCRERGCIWGGVR